jgi:hypothetical protein
MRAELALALALFALPAAAAGQADDEPSLRAAVVRLSEGAAPAEEDLLAQARAALEAAVAASDEPARQRALAIATAAIDLVRARRERADAERARRDAEQRRDEARARRETARARRDAAVRDAERGP